MVLKRIIVPIPDVLGIGRKMRVGESVLLQFGNFGLCRETLTTKQPFNQNGLLFFPSLDGVQTPHSHSKCNKVTHWPDTDKISILALLENLLHAGKTSDTERTALYRKAAW